MLIRHRRRSEAAVAQQLQQSLKLLAVCAYDEEDCVQQAVATMRTGSRPCLALRATHAFTSNHAAPTHKFADGRVAFLLSLSCKAATANRVGTPLWWINTSFELICSLRT